MSILFSPFSLGSLQIRNRFIFSAGEDNLATDTGTVTDEIITKNKALAEGEIGLIVSSHLSVHVLGRTRKYQLGIHRDDMIPGLKKMVETVHQAEGRIIFQLGHAGLQASHDVIGQAPLGPSSDHPMNEDSIQEIIHAFRLAAGRAIAAGADGVQLHAAHGYLINEFLSPYYNRREDGWGGSEENRFRLLGDIIGAVKGVLDGKPLLVKLNSHDYTPSEGITPVLVVNYAKRLAAMKIDGLEISCGTSLLSPWNMCRGDVPVQELLKKYDEGKKPSVEAVLRKMEGKFGLVEGYNLESARMIRPVMGSISLFAVGGWRQVSSMEKAVHEGDTDFISMCRPFIREPSLVQKIRKKKTAAASCTSCNKCLAALANDIPVQCYIDGF